MGSVFPIAKLLEPFYDASKTLDLDGSGPDEKHPQLLEVDDVAQALVGDAV